MLDSRLKMKIEASQRKKTRSSRHGDRDRDGETGRAIETQKDGKTERHRKRERQDRSSESRANPSRIEPDRSNAACADPGRKTAGVSADQEANTGSVQPELATSTRAGSFPLSYNERRRIQIDPTKSVKHNQPTIDSSDKDSRRGRQRCPRLQ
jgi:hypothetical protein